MRRLPRPMDPFARAMAAATLLLALGRPLAAEEALLPASSPASTASTASTAFSYAPTAPAPAAAVGTAPVTQQRDPAAEVVFRALSLLGVNYRWGGNTVETGLDCSGLVRLVFHDTLGLPLPRRSDEISRVGGDVSPTELQPGDLVFFNTLRRAFSHVGIYIGNNQFVHAPSSGGSVRVENLGASYWTARFDGARRVLNGDFAGATSGFPSLLAGSQRGRIDGMIRTEAPADVADTSPTAPASSAASPRLADAAPIDVPTASRSAATRAAAWKATAVRTADRRTQSAAQRQAAAKPASGRPGGTPRADARTARAPVSAATPSREASARKPAPPRRIAVAASGQRGSVPGRGPNYLN